MVGRANYSQIEVSFDYKRGTNINEKAKLRRAWQTWNRRIRVTNTDSVPLTPSHEEATLRNRWWYVADTSLIDR